MKLMARRKPAAPLDLGAAYINSTPDPIILVQDGIVIDCNVATEFAYGFTRDQLIGQYNTIFFPERQPCGTRSEELAGNYMKEMFSGGYARFTWTGLHKDGHQIPLILTAFMIKADGKDLVIITTQDYSLTNAMIVQLTSALKALAAGDLSSEIDQPFQAEYEPIRNNLNTAMENLRTLIGAVSDSAAAIRTGSGEIAQAAEDLARRTESGAAALEETAASLTQMDGRLRSSAKAANQTVESADHAIVGVTGGREVAEEAVQAMNRVSESAKGIDSVIEGLDKIAFQTRVLAMNAAVEAGRAGDAGRGFAVVADLVSALAMRAEEEAKRARDQLKLTQTDIGTAVEAVTRVDGALAGISGEVGEVHEKLSIMARDNQAQSAAITEISVAIGSMDQSTQQNAAMVEETSAAARNLATEVDHLARQAGRFTTTGPSAGRSGKASQRTGGARETPISIAARTQIGEHGQSAGRSYQAAAMT